MSDIAIEVENLSKCYRIGLKEQMHETFGGALGAWLKSPFENLKRLKNLTSFKPGEPESDDMVWALKDVSFSVKQGEVLGIIGRNGAGKSTLLKILSRIVEPTSGRASINGRVASLLEVGTGFHQELTGRENIYLNGAVLGMTKREIDSKFDEIVAFAEIGKFLDTPVKRYSSGMTVRLAFAVAAHLDPEILLIDEVLAVGDIGFQKKCLGKMGEVSRAGRTVLFVSHNMAVVNALCEKVILLQAGRVKNVGLSSDMIAEYKFNLFEMTSSIGSEPGLWCLKDNFSNADTVVEAIEMLDPKTGKRKQTLMSGDQVAFKLYYRSAIDLEDASFMFGICTEDNTVLIKCNSKRLAGAETPIRIGQGWVECIFPFFPLAAGNYFLMVGLAKTMVKWLFLSNEFGRITILPRYRPNAQRALTGDIAYIYADHFWRTKDKRE